MSDDVRSSSEEEAVTPLYPMTREQACVEARRRFGDSWTVGRNVQYPRAPYYVGVQVRGEFVRIGFGATWDEAFANIREVVLQKANKEFVFKDDGKKQV